MKTKLFITVLAFFAVTISGFSQNRQQTQNQQGTNPGNCAAWVDENKNGLCDAYENRTPGQGMGKGNGNGYCGGKNQGQCKGMMNGKGQGMMNGQGGGRNFVDENNNGVCDRFEETQKSQPDKK